MALTLPVALCVLLTVLVAVPERVWEMDRVWLMERVRLLVSEAVMLGVWLLLTLLVPDGVGRLLPLPVPVRLGLLVEEALCVMLAGVDVTEGVAEMEGIRLVHSNVRRMCAAYEPPVCRNEQNDHGVFISGCR